MNGTATTTIRVYYSELPDLATVGGVAHLRAGLLRIFLYAPLPLADKVNLVRELTSPEERPAALQALGAR